MGKSKGGRVRIKQVGGGGTNAAAAAAAAASLFQNPLEGLPPEQMMQWVQPKPDPNFQMIWPLTETFTMKFSNFSVIYPNYLDGTKTVKQGRRISQQDAVSPCPALADLQQALQILQLRHVVQPYKGYSRDAVSRWENPGRVLVDLESYEPQFYQPDLESNSSATKKTLLRDLAKCISQLPSRMDRLRKEEEQRKVLEAQQQQQLQQQALVQKKTTSAAAPSSSGDVSNKKKKGNKKKK